MGWALGQARAFLLMFIVLLAKLKHDVDLSGFVLYLVFVFYFDTVLHAFRLADGAAQADIARRQLRMQAQTRSADVQLQTGRHMQPRPMSTSLIVKHPLSLTVQRFLRLQHCFLSIMNDAPLKPPSHTRSPCRDGCFPIRRHVLL